MCGFSAAVDLQTGTYFNVFDSNGGNTEAWLTGVAPNGTAIIGPTFFSYSTFPSTIGFLWIRKTTTPSPLLYV